LYGDLRFVQGRSFGTNMMEAALTAYAGKGRVLTDSELNALIEDLDLRPNVMNLHERRFCWKLAWYGLDRKG